jgi:hypothetical protein
MIGPDFCSFAPQPLFIIRAILSTYLEKTKKPLEAGVALVAII